MRKQPPPPQTMEPPLTTARRIFVPCAPTELDSFSRIDWVLRTMFTEVKRHRRYPYTARGPTIREVLRRALLSDRFLEVQGGNPYREERKVRYKYKIKRVLGLLNNKKMPLPLRGTDTDKLTASCKSERAARDELRSLRQRWVEAELEYTELQNRILALEGELRRLTSENVILRSGESST